MRILNPVIHILSANDFVKKVSILVSGTALSQFVAILAMPVLTRIYTPEQFGFYSIYLAILFSLSVIVSMQYEMAIPHPESDRDAFHILCTAMLFVVSVSISVFIFILYFQDVIANWMNVDHIRMNLLFIPISLLGLGTYQVFNVWLIRKESYPSMTKGKVTMNISQVVGQLTFGLLSFGSLGLVVGDVAGRVGGSSFLGKSMWRDLKEGVKGFSPKLLKQVSIRYKKFPMVSSISSIINELSLHLPLLFVAFSFGPKVAGLYMLAQRILTLPDALVGFSVKQVYLSESTKQARVSYESFRSLYWQTLKKMSWLGVIVIGCIALLSPLVFGMFFGDNWSESGSYVQVLAILYLFQLITGPTLINFYVLECQWLQIISETIRLIIIVGAAIVAHYFIQSTFITIAVLSIAASIGYLVLLYFSWYSMRLKLKGADGIG
ncbi:lipopolysaccharide biosynthesis protein [Pseudalkalibacillus berkeleyi]|uniref:Lipopolysaccharide biosynthesis protein n=1 Tax=Pseudalkalibacillus berkeleyi TaxID=1069813 RepID=A0ABS9H163_9BACL|nr:lipopolysaccharide biosynthesis protein [Pseudalkalibacillus berkeleyi]MCF6138732.1 lipopolysaccharide biosynthesis protein [Pseudalkalibacillus berkeleyi]